MAYTAIDDPSAHFHTMLYTGNGSTNAITNDANAGDLQPDLLWIKTRSHSSSHRLMDSSRLASGEATLSLRSEDNAADSDIANDGMTSLDSDGFTLNGNGSGGAVNEDTKTYVAWQWKANGGSLTTNDASATSVGSIDSVYQANTTAGFSIVTYTGTGVDATVAHGLGAVPDVLLFKKRSTTDNWYMYHSANTAAPETDYMTFDTTAATTDYDIWDDTAPTSTVFSISNAGVHADTTTMVCWAWREIQGYSRFGSYTGNGNDDGPFVYTGFKPAFFIQKRSDSAGNNWNLVDNKRSPFNIVNDLLYPDSNSAEYDTDHCDFLSNGIKMRADDASFNADGGTYIYAAFAEQPFVTSGGVPATAR